MLKIKFKKWHGKNPKHSVNCERDERKTNNKKREEKKTTIKLKHLESKATEEPKLKQQTKKQQQQKQRKKKCEKVRKDTIQICSRVAYHSTEESENMNIHEPEPNELTGEAHRKF